MDIAAILTLVTQGISVAEALLEAGQTAAPAFEALKNLLSGAQSGTVTQADLDATESVLDGLINEFNLDLPSS